MQPRSADGRRVEPGMSASGDRSPDPHGGRPVQRAGPPLERAHEAILLVHGRGASADDIMALGRELVVGPAADRTALLAPEAAGHAWYPESFLSPIARNEPWLSSGLARLEALREEAAAAGIPAHAVAVAGFSQGACLATEFVARHPARYRALLAFTGGLIGPPLMEFSHEGDLGGMPAYLSAGDRDPHVPWRRMEATREVLERMGARVTLRRWPGRPHTILRREVEEARGLLAAAAGRA